MSRQRKLTAVPSTQDASVLRLLAQVAAIKERIGARIREAREEKGWRQRELAAALPGDVESASVSRWEKGRVRPQDETLEAIAAALGKPVSYFLEADPGPPADLMGLLANNGDGTRLERIERELAALRTDVAEILKLLREREQPKKSGRDPAGVVRRHRPKANPPTPPQEPEAPQQPRRKAG